MPKLALTVWEHTPEFQKELDSAINKFSDISDRLYQRGFTSTYLGNLRLDMNGNPEAWLNENRPYFRSKLSVEDAKKFAVKYGDTGWWNLDELEEFIYGKGPMFENAMWDMGFRIHKTNPNKWTRRNSKDKYNSNEFGDSHKKMWHEKHDKIYLDLSDEQLVFLNNLWVLPNEFAGVSKTYNIRVDKRGMIYVELQVNPFAGISAETLHVLSEQIINRGHIAKQQEGFHIDAWNVKFTDGDGVYIKAISSDKNYAECIWPSQIPIENIYGLADDLVVRVNKIVEV